MIDNPHHINIKNADINDEVCNYCHTVSDSAEVDEAESTPIFTMYCDSTPSEAPTDISKSSTLCLSCHDGLHAKEMAIKTPFSINPTNSHPISIEYIEGKCGLKRKNTPIDDWDNASTIRDLLSDGKIECISCHNPHNRTNDNYLRHDNYGSALCFTCHDK